MELEPRKSATRAGLAVYLFLSIAIVADPGREPLIDVALALPDPRCVCVCAVSYTHLTLPTILLV